MSSFYPLFLLWLLQMHGIKATTFWGDIEVLKQIKNGVDRSSVTPGSCLSTWDFTVDPCDNVASDRFTCGFRCDGGGESPPSRLTELALDQWGYSGSLESVSWDRLTYLEILDLSGNYFEGIIPESISNLTRLRVLSLSHNSLSGQIPNSFDRLGRLEELYLAGNRLTGEVTLAGLKNLKRVDLQDNKFSGGLPELGELDSLSQLDASNNFFSGEIPARLPANLVEFAARNNSIGGNIPAESAAGAMYLQVLDLSHNRLTGSVPASLFTHPSLQQLTLSNNKFGSIQEPDPDPNTLQNSQLVSLDLSDNEIHGLLPGLLGQLPKLSSLSLENNKLSGLIPAQYALRVMFPGPGLSQFERLLLGGNYLFGAIPGQLMGLEPGRVMIRLGDNCLYRCPMRLFLCEGGEQKSLAECKAFGSIIP